MLILLSFLLTTQASKTPAPAAADLRKAEKSVRELLAKDYSLGDKAGRLALCKKLLTEAGKTAEAPEAYVLLRDAIENAAAVHDFGTMVRAIEQLDKRFQVVIDDVRLATFATAKKNIAAPDDAVRIADASLFYWEQGIRAEDFDSAIKWAKEAETFAKLGKDQVLTQIIKDMILEAGENRRDQGRAEVAKLTLAKIPNDEAANCELGSYLCFVRGKWTEGLPWLSQGPAGSLKDLAQKDLAAPIDAEAKADLALAWKAAGDKERSSVLKKRLHLRSLYWQDEAFKGTTGIARRKLEKRFFPPIVIHKASIKVEGSTVDVQKQIQEAIETNPSSPVVADFYSGGPFPGSGRVLTVEYTVGVQRMKDTVGDWEGMVFPGVSPKGTPHPQSTHGFHIVSAYYGGAYKYTDVTEKARAVIPDAYTRFSGEFAGIDPLPGVNKSVVIVFDLHGRRFIRSLRQSDVSTLAR